MNFKLRSLWMGLALGASLCWALPAAALSAPEGPVILTISGRVGEPNQGSAAVFDRAMLERLPQQSFTTQTPWDKQPIKFTGPLLRDVLQAAKAQGKTLTALALNDYKTHIPMEDAELYDVIVAHKMNDRAIPIRTKGPLFIVYPFDAKPELKAAKFYERSAWQLKALSVV